MLESNAVATFQIKHLACFIRGRDLRAEVFHDSPDFRDLLCVRCGQFAATDEKAVLKTNPHVPAHLARRRCKRHLRPARRQNRPAILVAQKLVRGLLHEDEVLDIRTDAAQNAQHELQEDDGRLQ